MADTALTIWMPPSLSLWNYDQGKGVGAEMKQLADKLMRGWGLSKSSIRAKENEPKFRVLHMTV